jgi:CheY-like chemotaxis protein
MKPGGRIWLSVERVPAATGAVVTHEIRISVRDAGSGIDPEFLPRIFDMFTQGSSDIEHGRGGLGIGLTLAKNLVEMHEGRIEVHSEGTGHGSEFIVFLPLPDLNAAPEEAPPRANDLQPGVPERRRILVVDDNPDQARSLHLLLELLGHEVRVAGDGPSALAAVEAEAPEVALIDIGLPGMSGYEVATRIRKDSAYDDVLLVAQTGWGQEHDRHRSVEAGFDHHLVKPLDLEALRKILLTSTPRPG